MVNPNNKSYVINIPAPLMGVVGIMIAVQLAVRFLPTELASELVINFAFIPERDMAFEYFNLLPFMSYSVVHGGWFHFLVNVAMIVSFGKVIIDASNNSIFWCVTLISAIGGALGHLLIVPWVPVIGASGIISGYIGAIYALGYYGFWLPHPLHVKRTRNALVIMFVVMNILFIILPHQAFGASYEQSFSWGSHLGGFVAGMVVTHLIAHYMLRIDRQ